jgi:Lipocalin-like domain
MAESELVGTWALVATEWRRADGRHANPFGPGAVGVLTYDGAGNMAAQVMRAERPKSPDGQSTSIESAMSSAFAGYIGYFGTYEIDRSRGVVVHTVIGAAFPPWVGGTPNRRFVVEGDRLTLSDSVTASDGTPVEASTVWQRIV